MTTGWVYWLARHRVITLIRRQQLAQAASTASIVASVTCMARPMARLAHLLTTLNANNSFFPAFSRSFSRYFYPNLSLVISLFQTNDQT